MKCKSCNLSSYRVKSRKKNCLRCIVYNYLDSCSCLQGSDVTTFTSDNFSFDFLREYRNEGRQFDIVVLDPPKFAENRNQLEKAARGYKDINLLGFKLLRPGGLLFTFSCSGLMESALFQKIVADAAVDAGCNARILHKLDQATDHPTRLAFPEGYYLKGLVCQK